MSALGRKPSLDRPFAVLQYETGKLLRGTAIGGGRWSLYDLNTLVAHCRIGNSLPQLLAGLEVRHVLLRHASPLAASGLVILNSAA